MRVWVGWSSLRSAREIRQGPNSEDNSLTLLDSNAAITEGRACSVAIFFDFEQVSLDHMSPAYFDFVNFDGTSTLNYMYCAFSYLLGIV